MSDGWARKTNKQMHEGTEKGGRPPTGGAGPTPPYARRAHARRSRSRRGRGERQLLLCLTESLCKETLCSLAACLSLFVNPPPSPTTTCGIGHSRDVDVMLCVTCTHVHVHVHVHVHGHVHAHVHAHVHVNVCVCVKCVFVCVCEMCVCNVCMRRWDVRPPTRGPGSHSNNPYLLEHSYGLLRIPA